MPTIENLLEALIDKHGLLKVIEAIETICDDKAECFAVNYGDIASAKIWAKDANVIHSILDRVQS